jgi:hypothetical protein
MIKQPAAAKLGTGNNSRNALTGLYSIRYIKCSENGIDVLNLHINPNNNIVAIIIDDGIMR